jgi:TolB protein
MHLPKLLAILAASTILLAQPKTLGLFTDHGPVGANPVAGKAVYDAAKSEYRITGGGANVWDKADAFHFVWKMVTGDITLGADVEWVGTSPTAHRKAMLMLRQSLDPDSAYADAVAHGDGLTALQFRGARGENTYETFTNIEGPIRLRIVRKGSRFTMLAGKPNGDLQTVGPVDIIRLQGPIYVGLGVCSHVADRLETAVFKNVTLEPTK